jgi:hypothetical protein
VILKALAKTREQRFTTMAEMHTALRVAQPAAAVSSRVATQPASEAVAAGPRTTTFRAAAGEVTPATGIAVKRGGGRVALVVAVVAVAAGVALYAGGMFGPRRADEPAVATAVPPPSLVVTAPMATPAAREVAQPPKPATQVRLRLVSDPDGASVIDVSTGAVLGSTPLERQMDRNPAPLALRVSRSGFAAAELVVPLDNDVDRTVRLERVRGRSRAEVPAAKKPAAAIAAPAPAPAAAAPAAVPAPAVPAPRRVERW